MSINHYAMDLPEPTHWWTQHHQQQPFLIEPTQTQTPPIHPSWPPQPPPFPNYPSTTPPLNLNNQNDDVYDENDNDDEDDNNNINDTSATTKTETEEEKEPMFEKPLTPSDVGKLNRLVIPKQHAEKYFPLGDSGECKGLLLSFEDESGKCWRFRYSYWNSSQSYVLTKGWSRYVKDKRLDAGDVVLFERHRVDAQRLFISWRRRRQSENALPAHVSRAVKSGGGNNSGGSSKNEVGGGGVGVGWTRGFYSAHPYPTHHHPLPYQHDCLHAGRGSQGENQRTRPVGNSSSSSSSSSSKVLRLFGVNMECQPEHDSGPSTPQSFYNSNIMPTTHGTDHNHHFYHPSSNPHPHMVRHQPHYY